MRVLVWIVEDSWKATIAGVAAFVPVDAEITLLHVRAGEAESVALGALHGLLGRPHTRSAQSVETISEESEQQLLADAQALLGRQASVDARIGRVAQEVVAAAASFDLLLLARDGDRAHAGPHSLGPTTRYVVEHAPCVVLLVWPD